MAGPAIPPEHVPYEYGSGEKYHCECSWCEPRMKDVPPHPSKALKAEAPEAAALKAIADILRRAGL